VATGMPPGSRNRWKAYIFIVIGTSATTAKFVNLLDKSSRPQLISTNFRSGKKYAAVASPVKKWIACGAGAGCGTNPKMSFNPNTTRRAPNNILDIDAS